MKLFLLFTILITSLFYSGINVFAESYCTQINLCYNIPDEFYLLTKENSNNIAVILKKQYPEQNIGIYEDLFNAFYNNKIMPSDRVYVSVVNDRFLFISIITKKSSDESGILGQRLKTFKKIGAMRRGKWPANENTQLHKEFTQGLKEGLKQPNPSTGISSASGKLLWMSSEKKYIAAERTIDINPATLEKHQESGIPTGEKTHKFGTDCYALQFNERGMVVIQFWGDPSNGLNNYYHILKSMLDDAE